MQLTDIQSLRGLAEQLGEGARLTPLYPQDSGNGLLALDLLEVEGSGQVPVRSTGEEQVLFVMSGNGELVMDGTSVGVHGGSIVALGPSESYSLRNTDQTRLRVVVAVSLVARTARGMGQRSAATTPAPPVTPAVPPTPPAHQQPRVTLLDERTPSAEQDGEASASAEVAEPPRRLGRERAALRETPAEVIPAPAQPAAPAEEPAQVEQEPEAPPAASLPDISGLMKRGSDVVAKPRSEQRKPPPAPEPLAEEAEEVAAPEAGEAVEASDDEAAEQSNLMELQIVFDGGSRGNPGQGYGSFIVQSPGGRPTRPRRLEYGDNYTNNQAEYETLISALEYIIDRLNKTGRSPEQAQLDIRTDSDLVVNQILGNFKVKDAGLRKRHDQATALLSQFADWAISWHPRDESVRLLGH